MERRGPLSNLVQLLQYPAVAKYTLNAYCSAGLRTGYRTHCGQSKSKYNNEFIVKLVIIFADVGKRREGIEDSLTLMQIKAKRKLLGKSGSK